MWKSIIARAILPYCLAALLAGISVGAVAGLVGLLPAVFLTLSYVIFARLRWNRYVQGLKQRINVPLRDFRGKNSTEMAIKAGLGRNGGAK